MLSTAISTMWCECVLLFFTFISYINRYFAIWWAGNGLSETEYKGLRLVHLLTACAEAISNGSQDLAEVILSRLMNLVSPTGSTMERVGYYLYRILHSKVDPLGHMDRAQSLNTATKLNHLLGAFKLLHQLYPFTRIAHFTANQCILEAFTRGASNLSRYNCLHIIDFDIMEGIQWPPMMEALKSGNYAVGHMKITAIMRNDDDHKNSLMYSACKHTGRRLAEYAESLEIPFSFEEKELKNLQEIQASKDEIVPVNCMWGLPHMTERGKLQVWEFLHAVGGMNVDSVTFAMGPYCVVSETPDDFLDRFSGCLRNLCAVFDSLEAGLPQHGVARAIVELNFVGPTMCRFFQEEGGLVSDNFADIPLKCGFRGGVMSKESIMQAKYIVSCCGEGGKCYGVELVSDHQLLLKWCSTPLVWVSAWCSP